MTGLILLLVGGVLLSGCAATRTSPPTIALTVVKQRPAVAAKLPEDKALVYSVAIRFPSGYQSLEAKQLLATKVDQMMTKVNKKGEPRPDPKMSHRFDADEVALKSMAASLQLRQALSTNPQIRAFLVPCQLAATNGELALVPSVQVPVHHAVVDVNIVNVMENHADAPFFKWQGCNMSYLFSPMISVAVPGSAGLVPVAGTRRWLTKDGKPAIVLPEVVERRYTGVSYGLYMNYPIVKTGKDGFPPATSTRPAGRNGYYEFDSFLEGTKQDGDFTPYWVQVADVITDILAATPVNEVDLAPKYPESLGLKSVGVSQTPLARKFLQAEWKFMEGSDNSLIAKLNEAKWFEAVDEFRKAEGQLLSKAKSKYFWNQVAMIAMSAAGGAAMGAGSAAAMSSGVAYNPNTTALMTMSAVQALGAAGSADQAKAYDIYKTMTAKTQSSVTAVALGLGEESAGATFTTIEQIRDLARKKLAVEQASR